MCLGFTTVSYSYANLGVERKLKNIHTCYYKYHLQIESTVLSIAKHTFMNEAGEIL